MLFMPVRARLLFRALYTKANPWLAAVCCSVAVARSFPQLLKSIAALLLFYVVLLVHVSDSEDLLGPYSIVFL